MTLSLTPLTDNILVKKHKIIDLSDNILVNRYSCERPSVKETISKQKV